MLLTIGKSRNARLAGSHGPVVSFYRSTVTNYVLLHLHLFLSLILRRGTHQSKRSDKRQRGHVGSFLLPLWSCVVSTDDRLLNISTTN